MLAAGASATPAPTGPAPPPPGRSATAPCVGDDRRNLASRPLQPRDPHALVDPRARLTRPAASSRTVAEVSAQPLRRSCSTACDPVASKSGHSQLSTSAQRRRRARAPRRSRPAPAGRRSPPGPRPGARARPRSSRPDESRSARARPRRPRPTGARRRPWPASGSSRARSRRRCPRPPRPPGSFSRTTTSWPRRASAAGHRPGRARRLRPRRTPPAPEASAAQLHGYGLWETGCSAPVAKRS